MLVFGTRPEAIKIAPLVKTLKNDPNFEVKVVVTAQHREMLDQVLHLFQIVPEVDLDIMEEGQSLSSITQKILTRLSSVLTTEKPDIVLVHGDTTTAFTAALSAFYHKIKIGHIEAGLRTYNKDEPFPEEANRRFISLIGDYHFAPTAFAKSNLLLEGIDPNKIILTGNTVIDALYMVVDDQYTFIDPLLQKVDFQKKVILGEVHRRENFSKLDSIFETFLEIVEKNKDVELIVSVHPNPTIREAATILSGKKRIHLITPPGYKEWVNLMQRSYLLLTDSGGLQEEAPALNIPVLVLRDVTERPEGLRAGTLRLVGTDKDNILRNTQELLCNAKVYEKMVGAKNPYGNGTASQCIKDALLYYFRGLKNLKST